MIAKKLAFVLFFIVFGTVNMFADNIRVVVEITGVTANGGNVIVEIYTNEQDHKKGLPFTMFILESKNNILTYEIELPEGECFIWAYQDLNNNGKLDAGFLGIPKEPIALTNYSGSGIPGGFKKHKVPVNKDRAKISVNLDIIRF